VARSGANDPALPGAEQAAVSPRIAPVMDDAQAPDEVSAELDPAESEPAPAADQNALTQPTSSPPKPSARAAAGAARARPAFAPTLDPAGVSPVTRASSTAAGLVPRRASGDKPPTAAYPLLQPE
jgi:hypothetical protein